VDTVLVPHSGSIVLPCCDPAHVAPRRVSLRGKKHRSGKERNLALRPSPCKERNVALEKKTKPAPVILAAPTLRPCPPASGRATAGHAELGNPRLAFSVAPCVAPRHPRSQSLACARARAHARTCTGAGGLDDYDGERRDREGGLDLAAAAPPAPGVHDGRGGRGRRTGTTSTSSADKGLSTGARR
jgi:hypothetical protein